MPSSVTLIGCLTEEKLRITMAGAAVSASM